MTLTGSGTSHGSRSTFGIFANIFISFSGAGVLGLPYAFKEAGVIEGTVVLVTVGAISIWAMLLIIECKYKLIENQQLMSRDYKARKRKLQMEGDKKHQELICNGNPKVTIVPEERNSEDEENAEECQQLFEIGDNEKCNKVDELSYGDLGYFAMGNAGRLIVDVVLLISQTGFCCAYLIFISENLSDYIRGMALIHWLLVLLPPMCLLTFFRHLNSLHISSMFAQCSSILAFAVVFWFDFEHINKVHIHPKKISLKGLPFFLAIAIYCYEGAGMVLSLEASIVREQRHRFNRIFIFTMILVTMLYITFGICGYLSFGQETNPIITLNLPKGKSLDFAMMVKSFLCLALFFTFPVMIFPVLKLLESYLIHDPDKHIWRGNVLRFMVVLSTGVVVIAIPNFVNLMALVGATCCTLLTFILPGIFHLCISKGSVPLHIRVFDILLILVGIAGAILGTVDALSRMGGATGITKTLDSIPNATELRPQ